MKLLSASPRQPFLGLAISAAIGILAADNWPQPLKTVALIAVAISVAAWFARSALLVYALVAAGFFFLHCARTVDSPGLVLARTLGASPRPVTVRGAVTSEPKTSERGTASFLLQAESIEI